MADLQGLKTGEKYTQAYSQQVADGINTANQTATSAAEDVQQFGQQLPELIEQGVQQYLTDNPPQAGGPSTFFVEVVGTAQLCVKEIPLLAATQLQAVWLGDNTASVSFQLDTHTQAGPRVYGNPNRTLEQVATLLAALQPTDFVAGVSLSVRLVAANAYVMRVQAGLLLTSVVQLGNLNSCDLFVFPGQAAPGLLLNANFATGFAADPAVGWKLEGAPFAYDSANKLAISADASEKYLVQQIPLSMKKGLRYRLELAVQALPNGTPASGSLQLVDLLDYNNQPLTQGAGKFTFDFTMSFVPAGQPFYLKASGFVGAIKRVEILPLSL